MSGRLTVSSPLPRPLSSFVGRRAEIGDLKRICAATRLVTLTGPGGCGKTRLAIEVAAETGDRFPDGVGFVDLAPLRDPDAVLESVAGALGLRQQAAREAAALIADARLLLVIDNAEQLVEAVAAVVEDLLRR